MKLSPAKIARFRKTIYSYFIKWGRDLPWRHTKDPYCILISEIMLQQTQVNRVVEKYPQFIGTFPDVKSLAAAPTAKVLAEWQGMGYNRRALLLKKCAQTIMEEFNGKVPDKPQDLQTLPGIGWATANSITAFAFNQPTVFIETNIRAVFIDHFFKDKTAVSDDKILPLLEQTLDRKNPCRFYSALMDYGSMLKKQIPNPGRKSAHYTRQSKFEGSRRQLRGKILKTLLASPGRSFKQLAKIKTGNGEYESVLKELMKEGFVKKIKDKYFI
ncbi:MAG: hypothetical protein PHC61_07660 [Chitinivibrionales bacterium]|nr:hypothetical protein [Chitinivibrionales bacterium]